MDARSDISGGWLSGGTIAVTEKRGLQPGGIFSVLSIIGIDKVFDRVKIS